MENARAIQVLKDGVGNLGDGEYEDEIEKEFNKRDALMTVALGVTQDIRGFDQRRLSVGGDGLENIPWFSHGAYHHGFGFVIIDDGFCFGIPGDLSPGAHGDVAEVADKI